MAGQRVYLAVDLGASGGRVLAGKYDGARVALREMHRFPNGPVRLGERLHWDLPGLWLAVQQGLHAAAEHYGDRVASVGVDTWGVDYGLLGPGDELLGLPYHYRDPRTRGALEHAFGVVPREAIFAETGLQFMELNTLYQLAAAKRAGSPVLAPAETLLLMPDLFHWLLTGEKVVEQTNASTTQLYNPRTQAWSDKLIAAFGLRRSMFGPIATPGTPLGGLLTHVREATGLGAGVRVVLPGSHDTASAVAAVPAAEGPDPSQGPNWCYLSSGTWSLMGIESPHPVVTDQVARLGFTNEAGINGATRLLRNITGLWLAQECRRVWSTRGKDYGWEELAHLAAEAPPLVSVVNPDDPRLGAPTDMPAAIATLCRETGQPTPATPGATIRCCLESIALRCRQTLRDLEMLGGRRLETVHIVGGGVQNELLCQLTADACERPVLAGPVEATALGNVLVQAISQGDIANLADARRLVRASFDLKRYEPTPGGGWAEAAARLAG